jgi:hypothetical protein
VSYSAKRNNTRGYVNAIGAQKTYLADSHVIAIEGIPANTMWQFENYLKAHCNNMILHVWKTNRSESVGRFHLEATSSTYAALGRLMATQLPTIYEAFLEDPNTTINSHDSNFSISPSLASNMRFDDPAYGNSSLASASCQTGWYSTYDLSLASNPTDDGPTPRPPNPGWHGTGSRFKSPDAYGGPPTFAQVASPPVTPQVSDLTASERQTNDSRLDRLETMVLNLAKAIVAQNSLPHVPAVLPNPDAPTIQQHAPPTPLPTPRDLAPLPPLLVPPNPCPPPPRLKWSTQR